MGLPIAAWTGLAVFAALTLVLTMYALTVAGHFPAAGRRASLTTGGGRLILAASLVSAVLLAAWTVDFAMTRLPFAAAVIAGGGAVLVAPLALQSLSDDFVDGWPGLVLLPAAGLALAALAACL